MEQSRWNDPAGLVAICETGIRNGARTPLLLYSYGTGLRQSGRIADASAIFAQIPKESDYYPYALFAIGQIAAEEGRAETAREVFDRVRESSRERGAEDFLAERVTRSQAELLMTLGRPGEAAPLFGSLLREGKNQLAEIGWAAVDNSAWSGDGGVYPETIAGWPVKKQILLSLLLGGLSRDRGQFAAAVAHFRWAEEKIKSSLASSTPSATETYDPFEPVEFLRRQVERHRSLRYLIASSASTLDPERKRERMVELLVELLFIDHSIDRALIRTIEQVTLGGVEVDRLVEDLARKLDIFQNLAHPIDRYRLLTRLEKSQGKIHTIKRRIHERREAAVAGVEGGGGRGVPMSRLLVDVGRFLVELDAIREAARELRAFTDRHFNILRPKEEKADPTKETFDVIIRKALAIDRVRFDSLLPAVKALEENARIVSWERKRQEISGLRPVVARQIVDALVGQARFLRARKAPDGHQEAWASLNRAVSYLGRDAFSPRDRLESSLQIGSFLEEGEERWEPSFPSGQ
jgi:tetratricopeptide (TPR) repeat protein